MECKYNNGKKCVAKLSPLEDSCTYHRDASIAAAKSVLQEYAF